MGGGGWKGGKGGRGVPHPMFEQEINLQILGCYFGNFLAHPFYL